MLNITENKKFTYLGILLLVIVGVIAVKNLSGGGSDVGLDGEKVKIQDARAKKDINHELKIPIKDNTGAELTEVKYFIKNAELRDEIVVKGKKGIAVSGRTFLILNIRITNDYKKGVEINAKDFVRLALASNDKEWMAPEIHSDPVNAQAIASKDARVGFPVNENEKKFKLQVGEIDGEKKVIDLEF